MASGSKRKAGIVRRGFAEADVDALIAEREDDLNASIKQARAEVKKGIYSHRSVKQIAADGTKRLRKELEWETITCHRTPVPEILGNSLLL